MSEIVIFAVIAAFLGLRLYSVLGRHREEELPRTDPTDLSFERPPSPPVADDTSDKTQRTSSEMKPFDEAASLGLRAISAVDSRFNAADFVVGARAAYEMILTAYWRGERETLRPLVSDDVYAAFDEAIAAREAAGEVLENRLVRIDRAAIYEAGVKDKTARIMVRFDADIAAVTRDKTGKVIAGSLVDAVPTHDAWTFERHVKSSDPDWLLVDTDEAE